MILPQVFGKHDDSNDPSRSLNVHCCPKYFMNTKPSALKQVLFVDDSPKFLQKLRTKMPAWSRDNWGLLFASDSSKAFTILETQQVDMIVIDLGVSDMESLQFLKLVHQKHPHIRKAILTSFVVQETRKACLESGADMYLIKPKRTNGFEAVFHSLNQLFTLSQQGFRGLLRTISLTDLIQLECLNARSSVLEISADKQFGRVFIKHGAIIHAQAGSKTGVDAFIRLMHMSGGDFNLKPFVEPGAQTIQMSCDRLLLEASHAVDNGLAGKQGNATSESNTTWFQNTPREISLRATDESQNLDSPNDSIHFLQDAMPASDHTDFFPASALNPQSSDHAPVNFDTVINLTDELIANRSQLDMKILDLALLKEELNGCKSRLTEVIGHMQDCAKNTQQDTDENGNADMPVLEHADTSGGKDKQTKLASFIYSLNEISNDAGLIVTQLDSYFATFTEESGCFNETSAKLQDAISSLSETSAATI